MCAELASEATGVALMQFSGILGDIYGMEPVLRSLALVAHLYFTCVAVACRSTQWRGPWTGCGLWLRRARGYASGQVKFVGARGVPCPTDVILNFEVLYDSKR